MRTKLLISGSQVASGSLSVSPVLTWQPGGPNDVAPPKVIVSERCSAFALSFSGLSGSFSATVNNGGLGTPQESISEQDKTRWVDGFRLEEAMSPDAGGRVTLAGSSLTASVAQSDQQGPVGLELDYELTITTRFVSGESVSHAFSKPPGFPDGSVPGNTVVKLQAQTVHEGPWPGDGHGVRFSSINFPHLTPVVVETSVQDAGTGRTYVWKDIYVTYNRYVVQECSDFIFSMANEGRNPAGPEIRAALDGLNHQIVNSSTAYEFQRASFLRDIPPATVVHVNAHGAPAILSARDTLPPEASVTSDEVNAAVGSVSWAPRVALVYAAACFTGSAPHRFPHAFLKGDTPSEGFGAGRRQAYIGYTGRARIDGIQAAAEAFWTEVGRRQKDVQTAYLAARRTHLETVIMMIPGVGAELNNRMIALGDLGFGLRKTPFLNSTTWWEAY